MDKRTVVLLALGIAATVFASIFALVIVIPVLSGTDESRPLGSSPVLLTATTDRIPTGQQLQQSYAVNVYTNNEQPLIHGTVSKSVIDPGSQEQVVIDVYYPNGTFYLHRQADVSPSDGHYEARIPMDYSLTGEDATGQFNVKVSYRNRTAYTWFIHQTEYGQDPTSSKPARSHLELSIEGLKERYVAGEEIVFEVHATGYGRPCGYPTVQIVSADSNEIVYDIGAVSIVFCDPDMRAIDVVWTLEDIGAPQEMKIDCAGSYEVVVYYDGRTAEGDFVVLEER